MRGKEERMQSSEGTKTSVMFQVQSLRPVTCITTIDLLLIKLSVPSINWLINRKLITYAYFLSFSGKIGKKVIPAPPM